jgi:hypothetical protein
MPRLAYVGALLAIATSLSAPVFAQKSAQNSAPNPARVQRVVVRANGNAMEVEIQTSGAPIAPDTQSITGPDRIVVDFPGALPAADLRALKVNRGTLKTVRSGLFFSNPPITRVVLDLTQPQSYQISTTQTSTAQNTVVVKLGSPNSGPAQSDPAVAERIPPAPAAKLQNATLAADTNAARAKVAAARLSTAVANTPLLPVTEAPPPPQPPVTVTFVNGMLTIRADKATLAQVLFEVQRQTQAEIAIPAGAEQEQVVADLGPAPARDVLASLLNGSAYNFIFVGTELTLEQVILTRRDPNIF